MKNIILTRINGWRYTDSVKDKNPIHQTDEEAKAYGFDRAVVPGMWLVSHIQSRSGLSSIKQIKFSDNLFYEDSILMNEISHKVGGKRDFEFKKNDKVLCSVTGVGIGEYAPAPEPLKERLHTYDADVCPERISLFLSSIGYSPKVGDTPEMFLASLSAPALLDYGFKNNITGTHASLSFNMHSNYEPGIVKITIGNMRIKGPFKYLELRWWQNEKIIASGRAGVLTLNKNLERIANEIVLEKVTQP
jgi:hypothetical protein